MSDNITPQQYRAEMAYMNHEVANLKAQVQERDRIDPYNPFDNPTEYHHYNGDYSKISPLINETGYKIPLEPMKSEKRGIRHYYNIAGFSLLISEILTIALFYALIYIFSGVIMFLNPKADLIAIDDYMRSGSIYMGINMFIFLLCNVGISLLGLKLAKIKISELFKTTQFTFSKGFQYVFIAIFLQTFSAYISLAIGYIIEECGYTAYVPDGSAGQSTFTGIIVSIIYGCIIAPVTEELFYRGMLLKLFSKANQRFGIIFTAFLFGLAHGNIAQFSLGFIVGIFLGHITQKHNSIIPAIICHIAVNAKSEILSHVYDTEYGYIIATAITMSASIFGLIMLFDFRLKNKLPATTPHQTRRGFTLAVFSIPLMLTVVYQIYNALTFII